MTSTDLSDLVKDEVLRPRTIGGIPIVAVEQKINWINFLVYGDPGVGKTVLAGSAAEVEGMAPVLMLDIEGGTFSLRRTYPDVEVVRVKRWPDIQSVYDELRKGIEHHGFRTIVLDSLTEIQKFSMYNIMNDLLKEHPDRDPEVPSVREWGKSIEQIRLLVRAFRDLDMHTIFTALADHDKDQMTGVWFDKPQLPGKLKNEVAGFTDIVAYYYMKKQGDEMKRFLLTQKTDKQIAKDRSGVLPMVIEDPTMKYIYTTITQAA